MSEERELGRWPQVPSIWAHTPESHSLVLPFGISDKARKQNILFILSLFRAEKSNEIKA